MNHRGLTLIEVLVALVVISIALTAIIKATSQTIKTHHYLEKKMMAAWIANNKMNEIRAGLVHIRLGGEPLQGETRLLNMQLPWQAISIKTANPHIQQIDVTVLNPPSNATLVHLIGYVYVTEQKN